MSRRRAGDNRGMRRTLLALATAGCLATGAHAQGYADYHGAWQGTLLFSSLDKSGFQVTRHASSPARLEIADDGGVSGRLPAVRCTIAGTAADFRTTAHAELQLDLSACQDPRLNGRYQGRLLTSLALEHASLRAKATAAFDREPVELSGILRR